MDGPGAAGPGIKPAEMVDANCLEGEGTKQTTSGKLLCPPFTSCRELIPQKAGTGEGVDIANRIFFIKAKGSGQ